MAGNFEDLPYVGDFGRQLLACASVDEARALIGSTGGEVTVDGIGDATDTGKAVMKAASPETARAAIGAGTSSFNGTYEALTGKPTIPAAPAAATTARAGLVKQASIADNADAAGIVTALKAAGIAVTPASGDEPAVDQPSGI